MTARNPNHPPKGSTIKVEPIRKLKDIATIKKLLKTHPRNSALFVVGINTNLRASDLLGLTVRQVTGLKPNEHVEIREKKTGKPRNVTFNKTSLEAIRRLIESDTYAEDDYLFRSRKGPVLSTPSLTRLVKQWCAAINLSGNYGSHTLRKTWGYHQRVTFGVDTPRLVRCFNHSSERQTFAYLCIQPEEIIEVFNNEL